MASLTSALDKNDLETLVEAMNDWETIGNHEFHVMNLVKNVPIPPDDHDSHEFIVNIKDHFKQREKDIKATRAVREEKAVLLKAKLMLIKRDMGINQLFENASAPVEEDTAEEVVAQPKAKKPTKEQVAGLELAEAFIKDLGVWTHYEKFLAEHKNSE